jgi:uncharacterized protein YbaR (Trm112 family)
MQSAHMNPIDEEFLSIIRCPVTHSRLRMEGDWLIAETGGLRYPIRDGIPILLADEAVLPPGFASLDEFRKQFSVPAR